MANLPRARQPSPPSDSWKTEFDILSEAYEAAAIYRAEPIDHALAAAAAEARVVTGER